jgi:hypothetical protein
MAETNLANGQSKTSLIGIKSCGRQPTFHGKVPTIAYISTPPALATIFDFSTD